MIHPKQMEEVTVDTTVQEKNIAYPTDTKLLHRVLEKLVCAAKERGVLLRQSYKYVSKRLVLKQSKHAHAKQFARATKATKQVKTLVEGAYRKLLRRRSAIEPIFGHLKTDHRLKRNFLKGKLGDHQNALLAGAAFNFKKLLRYWELVFVFLFALLESQKKQPSTPKPLLTPAF